MHGLFLCLVFAAGAWAQTFNEEQYKGILEAHNYARSQIALGNYTSKDGVTFAAATNMRQLVWNATLAASASAHAESCKREHSRSGENLYFSWGGADKNKIGATALWFNEFYEHGPKNYTYSSQTGHATQAPFVSSTHAIIQVVWAKTASVGCGYAKCLENEHHVTCHYYPVGNYIGQRAYEQGPTCSNCPAGTKCDHTTGLCSSSDDDNCEAEHQ